MQFTFDLISDLHIETWGHFDWTGQATSPVCVVAGDICKDRSTLLNILTHLGQCYQAVFYIDGNHEHEDFLKTIDASYMHLSVEIEKIHNVVYLQNNVVVINGVAIVGTMGWWAFDFDLALDAAESQLWYQDKLELDDESIKRIKTIAFEEANYMTHSVKRLQKHQDVKKIVMVTHTVPDPSLIAHDIELAGSPRMNTMGNRYMMQSLAADTEKKIHTWCFGHYHGSIDQIRRGIRFVNNCRGRGDTKYAQHVYYPQRIVISY